MKRSNTQLNPNHPANINARKPLNLMAANKPPLLGNTPNGQYGNSSLHTNGKSVPKVGGLYPHRMVNNSSSLYTQTKSFEMGRIINTPTQHSSYSGSPNLSALNSNTRIAGVVNHSRMNQSSDISERKYIHSNVNNERTDMNAHQRSPHQNTSSSFANTNKKQPYPGYRDNQTDPYYSFKKHQYPNQPGNQNPFQGKHSRNEGFDQSFGQEHTDYTDQRDDSRQPYVMQRTSQSENYQINYNSKNQQSFDAHHKDPKMHDESSYYHHLNENIDGQEYQEQKFSSLTPAYDPGYDEKNSPSYHSSRQHQQRQRTMSQDERYLEEQRYHKIPEPLHRPTSSKTDHIERRHHRVDERRREGEFRDQRQTEAMREQKRPREFRDQRKPEEIRERGVHNTDAASVVRRQVRELVPSNESIKDILKNVQEKEKQSTKTSALANKGQVSELLQNAIRETASKLIDQFGLGKSLEMIGSKDSDSESRKTRERRSISPLVITTRNKKAVKRSPGDRRSRSHSPKRRRSKDRERRNRRRSRESSRSSRHRRSRSRSRSRSKERATIPHDIFDDPTVRQIVKDKYPSLAATLEAGQIKMSENNSIPAITSSGPIMSAPVIPMMPISTPAPLPYPMMMPPPAPVYTGQITYPYMTQSMGMQPIPAPQIHQTAPAYAPIQPLPQMLPPPVDVSNVSPIAEKKPVPMTGPMPQKSKKSAGDGTEELNCTPCHVKYKTKKPFADHIETNLHKKRFTAYIHEHMIQKKKKLFPCKLCYLVYKTEADYNIHLRSEIHSKKTNILGGKAAKQVPETPSRAPVAPAVPNSSISDEHEFAKTFCYECRIKFDTSDNLGLHKRSTKHIMRVKELEETPHPPPKQFCHVCNMWFPNSKQLESHTSLLLHTKTRKIFEKFNIPIPGVDYPLNPKRNLTVVIDDDDKEKGATKSGTAKSSAAKSSAAQSDAAKSGSSKTLMAAPPVPPLKTPKPKPQVVALNGLQQYGSDEDSEKEEKSSKKEPPPPGLEPVTPPKRHKKSRSRSRGRSSSGKHRASRDSRTSRKYDRSSSSDSSPERSHKARRSSKDSPKPKGYGYFVKSHQYPLLRDESDMLINKHCSLAPKKDNKKLSDQHPLTRPQTKASDINVQSLDDVPMEIKPKASDNSKKMSLKLMHTTENKITKKEDSKKEVINISDSDEDEPKNETPVAITPDKSVTLDIADMNELDFGNIIFDDVEDIVGAKKDEINKTVSKEYPEKDPTTEKKRSLDDNKKDNYNTLDNPKNIDIAMTEISKPEDSFCKGKPSVDYSKQETVPIPEESDTKIDLTESGHNADKSVKPTTVPDDAAKEISVLTVKDASSSDAASHQVAMVSDDSEKKCKDDTDPNINISNIAVDDIKDNVSNEINNNNVKITENVSEDISPDTSNAISKEKVISKENKEVLKCDTAKETITDEASNVEEKKEIDSTDKSDTKESNSESCDPVFAEPAASPARGKRGRGRGRGRGATRASPRAGTRSSSRNRVTDSSIVVEITDDTKSAVVQEEKETPKTRGGRPRRGEKTPVKISDNPDVQDTNKNTEMQVEENSTNLAKDKPKKLSPDCDDVKEHTTNKVSAITSDTMPNTSKLETQKTTNQMMTVLTDPISDDEICFSVSDSERCIIALDSPLKKSQDIYEHLSDNDFEVIDSTDDPEITAPKKKDTTTYNVTYNVEYSKKSKPVTSTSKDGKTVYEVIGSKQTHSVKQSHVSIKNSDKVLKKDAEQSLSTQPNSVKQGAKGSSKLKDKNIPVITVPDYDSQTFDTPNIVKPKLSATKNSTKLSPMQKPARLSPKKHTKPNPDAKFLTKNKGVVNKSQPVSSDILDSVSEVSQTTPTKVGFKPFTGKSVLLPSTGSKSANPLTTTNQSIASENKPATTVAKPASIAVKPTTTATKPVTTATKPATTVTKPATTTTKSATTETKPVTTSTKPVTTATKPATTVTTPATTTNKSATTEIKPVATATKLGTTATKPATTVTKPATTATKPATTVTKSATTTTKPATTTIPATTVTKPVTTTTKPATTTKPVTVTLNSSKSTESIGSPKAVLPTSSSSPSKGGDTKQVKITKIIKTDFHAKKKRKPITAPPAEPGKRARVTRILPREGKGHVLEFGHGRGGRGQGRGRGRGHGGRGFGRGGRNQYDGDVFCVDDNISPSFTSDRSDNYRTVQVKSEDHIPARTVSVRGERTIHMLSRNEPEQIPARRVMTVNQNRPLLRNPVMTVTLDRDQQLPFINGLDIVAGQYYCQTCACYCATEEIATNHVNSFNHQNRWL